MFKLHGDNSRVGNVTFSVSPQIDFEHGYALKP